MITPRPYQVNGIFKLKEKIAFDKKKRIVLMCPTGGGKGLIMAMLANMGLTKNSKVLTILYGSDLILQTDENYKRYYGIESNIIMGNKPDIIHNSTIASISTLTRRNLPEADFIIIDECHQTNSASYQKIFDHYPNVIIIGLSATPFNDLKNFEDCIVLASVQELIDGGYLVKPVHFKAKLNTVNTDGLKIVKGEWADEDLEREALKISGDVIQEWINRARNRPSVFFCVNVKHSMELCQAFINAGIRAVHLDGNTPLEVRQQALKDIQTGAIEVITNVMVIATGIDCPIVSCIGLVRPTHSEILFIQQIGRGLRTYPNKTDCMVIDYANNWTRFGRATDERLPRLGVANKRKTKKDIKPVTLWICEKCYCANESKSIVCEDCGVEKPKQENKIKTRSDTFEELTDDDFKKEKKRKIYMGYDMPFGKYKGTLISQLPYGFLSWAIANMKDDREGVKHRLEIEIKKRDSDNG